ncbi:hypothetical protein [Leucobacter sp. GX24907]
MDEMPNDEEIPGEGTRKKRWPWIAGAGFGALIIVGLIVAAVMGLFSPASDEAAPSPTPTEVTPETTPTPTPTPEPEVDIASTEFMPYSEVWNPPDQGESFWQVVDEANGYPEDGGTDYVLAHACDDPERECAGDQLRTLEKDDEFTYRGESYLVDQKMEIDKSAIGDQDIWYHEAGMLVVITCIIEENGDSFENDIVVARLAK